MGFINYCFLQGEDRFQEKEAGVTPLVPSTERQRQVDLCLRPALSLHRVLGGTKLHSETPSQERRGLRVEREWKGEREREEKGKKL